MSRHYRRHRSDSDDLLNLLMLTSVVIVIALYTLTPLVRDLIIAILLGLIIIGLTIALILYRNRVRHEQLKLRALTLADIQSMDGLVFERYVAELLGVQGYSNIRLTERFDMGVDIIAIKDGIQWGIQVKRYRNIVKAEAVRQVVTALNNYGCQRAMVVTNSYYSRPAKLLAESNKCVLVDRDMLAEWVITFQASK